MTREMETMNTNQLILEYFERGGCITVAKYRKPKKAELTFRNDRGSAFNTGRKAITLRHAGFKSRSAAAA
jgi:hypothetical protein